MTPSRLSDTSTPGSRLPSRAAWTASFLPRGPAVGERLRGAQRRPALAKGPPGLPPAGPPHEAPLLNASSPSRVPRLLDDGGSAVAPPLAPRPGASLLPATACF
ncbi:unnamed protein product [Rangifer tarandus platyrhynchus]|uniref:Uncharacterized protein n=2 Tax=Rangifer tarandus platyrhynchus TaxID=3082113 RepID=A0ABN8Y985_RANTA|nr:unnamed protein product [Rangifer tarandus platyrhynchus]